MTNTVCISANCCSNSRYPESGAIWVILNWALGLRALGCKVIWLEYVSIDTKIQDFSNSIDGLKIFLKRYGLSDCVAICDKNGERLPQGIGVDCLDFEEAVEADLLLNFHYYMPSTIVRRFQRSALVDIDPGVLQIYMSENILKTAQHDLYFTIGETVGQPGARTPDAGLKWLYTPPCVALDWWPVQPADDDAAFTTISHWWGDWMKDGEEYYPNDKRTAFLPFLDLPNLTPHPLELALSYVEGTEEVEMMRGKGWRIRDAKTIASTPWDYQRYIQNSLGEFSCAKPSCIRQQNAWISDRTICYLASGKPAIVQHTGPSRFLPDSSGLFRFRDLEGAVSCIEAVMADYEHQSLLARALVEEYFDARKVLVRVLELAIS